MNPEDADAIMTGAGEHKTGVGAAVTARWLGLHDTATGAVSVVDKSGKIVLWSSEAGDRSIWWGAMKPGGPRKVADRLVNNLKLRFPSITASAPRGARETWTAWSKPCSTAWR